MPTSKMESVVVGEPFLSWFKKEDMESLLLDRGFRIREHLHVRKIEQKYLALADGPVAEGSMPHFGFVCADVA